MAFEQSETPNKCSEPEKSFEPDDLWMHRSDEMRCYSCMHYNNFRCRKHAPTLDGWPAVYPRDWCGDHKLDKERMRGI